MGAHERKCSLQVWEMRQIMRNPVFDDPFFSSEAEGEACAVLDARGVLTAWSPRAERLLGYTVQDVRGWHWTDFLYTRSDGAGVMAKWGIEDNEMVGLGPIVLRHRDGRRIEVNLQVRLIVSTEGEKQWLVQAADVGYARRRELGDSLLASLFGDSPFILDVFDADLRFVAQTEVKVRAGWFSGKDFAGYTVTEVAPPGLMDWAAVEARQRQVLESGEALVQTEVRGSTLDAPDRERVWSESILPLRGRSGQVIAVAQVVADATERVRARERLVLVNDASTRIGSTLNVLHTAQELVDVAVPRFADQSYVNLLDSVYSGEEPTAGPVEPAELRLRRAAHSGMGWSEIGVAVGDVDTFASQPDSSIARSLACGKALIMSGNEVADELSAVAPERSELFSRYGVHSWMVIPMFARGGALGTAVFGRAEHADAFEDDDVLLAEELVARAAVCIDNARRYSRERATALGLQRSLLPQRLPRLAAVDTASRYLSASGYSGLGGAWFDVIPLSGARVALVVGEVVGRGLLSAVTMSRLRTAVRTLADLDLAPDELLTQLDVQVKRLRAEQGAEAVGATCVYAVYDPITHNCVLARAGHRPPILVGVGGEARLLDFPSSPRLGSGGAPFEVWEANLTEGELLVMYTGGLLREPEQGSGASPESLLAALSDLQVGTASALPTDASSEAGHELESVCDAMIQRLPQVPQHHGAAVLLARIRELPSDRHVTWDLPAVPEAVGEARAMTARKLADWGMHEESFTAELVVSELVTNAIRYGAPPIRLRLIRDQSLICEVSDGSSTSPHIRRALDTDEGGRGLFLVSQLSRIWGTRYSTRGKTIWAEQPFAD
ncbi:SpoIIE family protein phosphatase [Streptomyces mirabilis]